MATLTHDTRPGTSVAGLGFAITSAVSFGMSGSLGRALIDAGWSSAAAVAVRVLVGAVALLPLALRALDGRWHLLRRNVGRVVAFGFVAVAVCQFAYFNAVAHMPVAVALLIEYLAPLVVVAWMWARHSQRPGRLTLVGAVLAVVGLALVLDVFSGFAGISAVGVAWALLATIGTAFYFVTSAHDSDGLPGVVLATAALVVGGVALVAAGLLGLVPLQATTRPVDFAHFTAPWWAVALVLAVLSASVPYVTGIAASRRLGSRLASFVALNEVLASTVFAYVLLDQAPGLLQLVGALVVLAGVVAVKLGEGRTAAGDEALPSVLPSDEDLVRQQ